MQKMWASSNDYSLQWGNNRDCLHAMRKQVEEGRESDIDFKISPDGSSGVKGGDLVVSSEGFSTAFLNQVEHQGKIQRFISHASQQLGVLSRFTPNLLIVIRDPVAWIKSIYIQSIKEGGEGSAQEFVENQKFFIQNSLDLRHMVESYGRFFSNILILPYEILVEDESLFWGVISQTFGCPLIYSRSGSKQNVSPDANRVHLMACLNNRQRVVDDIISPYKDRYPVLGELSKPYLESGKWLHRRALEVVSEEEVTLMHEKLNISRAPSGWMEFSLDDETKEKIFDNYINFLYENILREFPDAYKASIGAL